MVPQGIVISLHNTPQQASQDLAGKGILTQVQPSAQNLADIAFCAPVIRCLSEMDIAQTLAVKECEVIAVEAIEGTSAMIRRAGELCPSAKWLLVTVDRPGRDANVNFPSVSVAMIEQLKAQGGSCLAVEAHKVILLDKPRLLLAADRVGVVVVGFDVQSL